MGIMRSMGSMGGMGLRSDRHQVRWGSRQKSPLTGPGGVEDCDPEGTGSMVEGFMANYLTRVELHRPYLDDAYARLHAALEKVGFKRVILGRNAEWYHLPHGQYTISSDEGVSEIVTLAKGVANGIHGRNEVLAVQYERTGVMWQGLKRVE